MNILVGSLSRHKLATVRSVFEEYFDDAHVVGADIASGVPPTPCDEQTLIGARARARGAQTLGGAEWYVGLESGLVERYGNMFEEAWACLIGPAEREYLGYSSGLRLPDRVVERMREGLGHAETMNRFLQELGIDDVKDTWASYSGGIIGRGRSQPLGAAR